VAKLVQVNLIPQLLVFLCAPLPALAIEDLDGCSEGRMSDKKMLSLHPHGALSKQFRPGSICLPLVPKDQGLRSCSPPQCRISFLEHDFAKQERKLTHMTLSKPLCYVGE
jgi:hypothetical protein